MRRGAAAVFVKTIGYSPLKTRLASGIGTLQAYQFYRLACQSIAEQLLDVSPTIKAYWAVAESQTQALAQWRDFQVISQGEGELGNRLAKVYGELLGQYEFVVLLGADAPQLSSSLLHDVAMQMTQSDFVIGPAADGGFYLLAGRVALAEKVWTSIPYSDAQTCELLLRQLKNYGDVHILEPLTDVDEQSDLPRLLNELQLQTCHSPSQVQLINWISQVLASSP